MESSAEVAAKYFQVSQVFIGFSEEYGYRRNVAIDHRLDNNTRMRLWLVP